MDEEIAGRRDFFVLTIFLIFFTVLISKWKVWEGNYLNNAEQKAQTETLLLNQIKNKTTATVRGKITNFEQKLLYHECQLFCGSKIII